VLEAIESDQKGILIIVRTHNGEVEHLLYVNDVMESVEFIEQKSSMLEGLVFASKENDDWDEYRVARAAIEEPTP
jgi:hypothetical protein